MKLITIFTLTLLLVFGFAIWKASGQDQQPPLKFQLSELEKKDQEILRLKRDNLNQRIQAIFGKEIQEHNAEVQQFVGKTLKDHNNPKDVVWNASTYDFVVQAPPPQVAPTKSEDKKKGL